MAPDTGTVVLCLVLALGIVMAYAKPLKSAVGGWISRDRKGRLVLALTPGPRKRKRRRR